MGAKPAAAVGISFRYALSEIPRQPAFCGRGKKSRLPASRPARRPGKPGSKKSTPDHETTFSRRQKARLEVPE
jgi:hypothetical protein